MKKLIDLLKTNKMTLIVSLPENSLELALAAVEGGADALKVHCGVKHKASGVEFGSLAFASRRTTSGLLMNCWTPGSSANALTSR